MHDHDTVAARRLNRALYDLGLDKVLGREWCSVGERCLDFAPLDPRQADRLIRSLEALAERLSPIPPPLPGSGQLGLDLAEGQPTPLASLRLAVSDGRDLART